MMPGPTSPQSLFSVVKAKQSSLSIDIKSFTPPDAIRRCNDHPKLHPPPPHSKRHFFTLIDLSRNSTPRQQTLVPSIDRKELDSNRRDHIRSDDGVTAMWNLRENATTTHEQGSRMSMRGHERVSIASFRIPCAIQEEAQGIIVDAFGSFT